ncbi:MAG: porin family protein [Calditrichaceae bacterium]
MGNFQMDSKQGLNIGAFAEFLDLPIVNLITEIGYTQKGMEDNFAVTSTGNPEGTGEFKTVTNRVDYLNLSLALKANYTMPIVTPYLYAGPRIDFLIMTDVDKGFKIVYDEYEKVVYGLKIGLGTEIMKILPVSILAEFQYNYDLSDSYKTALLKINNNSYELKIGIIL